MTAGHRASDGAWRTAAAAAAVLGLFSILFTAGAALEVWPRVPAGAFQGWDLWIGLLVGTVFLVYLMLGERVEN